MLPNVVPQATKAIADATKQSQSFGDSLKSLFSGDFSKGFAGLSGQIGDLARNVYARV